MKRRGQTQNSIFGRILPAPSIFLRESPFSLNHNHDHAFIMIIHPPVDHLGRGCGQSCGTMGCVRVVDLKGPLKLTYGFWSHISTYDLSQKSTLIRLENPGSWGGLCGTGYVMKLHSIANWVWTLSRTHTRENLIVNREMEKRRLILASTPFSSPFSPTKTQRRCW